MAAGGYETVAHGEPGTIDDQGQIVPGGEFGETDALKGMGTGAAKGAAAGATFGPYGVIIGGVLGGARGLITADAEAKRLETETRKATQEYIETTGTAMRKQSEYAMQNTVNEFAGGGADLNQNSRFGGVDPITDKLMGPVLPGDNTRQVNSGESTISQTLGGVSVNNRGFSTYNSGGTLNTNIPSDLPQNWG